MERLHLKEEDGYGPARSAVLRVFQSDLNVHEI